MNPTDSDSTHNPSPVDPSPVEPTSVDPSPVGSSPVEPTPVGSSPVDPLPVEPTPVKRQALELFSGLPGRYDRLSAALSFWQDPRWRRALVDAVAPADSQRILDVATGTGMVAAEVLARANCTVVGLDQSPEMLAGARARFAGGPDGARVELIEGQAERLPFADGAFDALTFTYLLRYVEDPPATVRELVRVLRPGGRIASLEFGVPPRALPRVAWRFYTAVGLPVLGGAFSHDWAEVGRFLGPSISGFYARHPLPAIVGYWRDAGLRDIRVRRMSLGGGVVMSATKSISPVPSSEPTLVSASDHPSVPGVSSRFTSDLDADAGSS